LAFSGPPPVLSSRAGLSLCVISPAMGALSLPLNRCLLPLVGFPVGPLVLGIHRGRSDHQPFLFGRVRPQAFVPEWGRLSRPFAKSLPIGDVFVFPVALQCSFFCQRKVDDLEARPCFLKMPAPFPDATARRGKFSACALPILPWVASFCPPLLQGSAPSFHPPFPDLPTHPPR